MVCLCLGLNYFKLHNTVCQTHSNIHFMQGLLSDCRSQAMQRPLIKQAEDVTFLTIDSEVLQKANHDMTVVVYGKNRFLVPVFSLVELT